MMELAEAAERAAEAGEESFAVRPSTFGNNEWSNAMDDSILKTPTTAAVTRTHGLTPLLIRKRVEKIGVTELRDVHEVFPDFGGFHTHLRTHLVRRGVDRKATIFKEKLKTDTGLNFFRDLNDWMSPSTDPALEQKHSQNSCISAWDIGNILGEHIDLSGSTTQATGSLRHKVEEGCSARQPIAIDAYPRPVKYETHKVHSSTRRRLRRALFDDNEDDFPRSLPETQTLQHTQTSNKQQAPDMYSNTQDARKSLTDFVTPVRLRDIRRLTDTDDQFDGYMSPSSLLDSPVYMVSENEEQIEQIGTALHNSRASLSSIMLPSLASTHSVDMRVETRDARMMEGTQPCKAVEDSRDEASEDMPISGFPILGPLLLDGATPFTSRENIRLAEIELQSNEGLLNAQLVRLNHEPSNHHYTSSIQTPMQDGCGCLGISTNSSLDSNEPSLLTPQDGQLSKLATVKEDRTLSTRVNPLASLISRMSPSSSVFHSMKNNRLYFRSKANDAFLNNYLYCSKSVDRSHTERLSLFSKTCHETPSSCMDLNVNSCCTAILPDTFSDVPNMKPTNNTAPLHSFVSLGRTSSLKSKAELWFDRATENFDHFLEKLSGAPSTNSARNISFQAPTLNKKIVSVPHSDLPPASPVSAVSDIGTVLDLDSISLKTMDLSTNK
ncbi:hypothetical protein FisN_11Lh249 [Fistulifera solaris]|uniref:Uncharacterized protein n=1 Tax=Fistulifera solaris TaxID=1519565 RepID=A0A1Z5J7I2_FISSO|nr:hypothetical protein FisN_11Lh249 [Fistulifera solaris]|eukprot:GAX09778.1 hypothetical protein FisN_11Lh249 [Fistulifera solaris]